MINCTKCNQPKDESEFRPRKTLTRGYQSWCRTCENNATKKKYIPKEKTQTIPKDAETVKLDAKKRMLKHRYNLSYETYLNMYEQQNHRCLICTNEFPLGGAKGLYVDHCHDTNKVRGLLCPNCNSGIGMLSNGKHFSNAMSYLNT